MNYTPHPTIVKYLKRFAPAQAEELIEMMQSDVNLWYLCIEYERVQVEIDEIKNRLKTINASLTNNKTQ